MEEHKEIFSRRVPFPKFKTKMKKTPKFPQVRYTELLCTLNNTSKFIKFKLTDIKNIYKDRLEESYIPEPEQVYESLTIDYRIVRHNKSKLDKDNVIWGLKWIADTMAAMGYVKDDKVVNFHSFDQVVDSSLPETMMEIRVRDGSDKW